MAVIKIPGVGNFDTSTSKVTSAATTPVQAKVADQKAAASTINTGVSSLAGKTVGGVPFDASGKVALPNNASASAGTPDWQTKLKSYATDKVAGEAEIARARQVYQDALKNNDRAGADKAHAWANQVREAMGLKAGVDYDPKTGKPITPGSSSGTGDGAGGTQSFDPYSIISNLISGGSGVTDAAVKASVESQTKALQTGIDNYDKIKGMEQQDALMADESSRQALGADNYLKFLQSRQAMANRGLAGSGLAADANARLAMAGNASLSKLYNDSNQQQAKIANDYNNKIAELKNKQAAITPEAVRKALEADAAAGNNERMKALGQSGLLDYVASTLKDKEANAQNWAKILGYATDANGNAVRTLEGEIADNDMEKFTKQLGLNRDELNAKVKQWGIENGIAVNANNIKQAANSIKYQNMINSATNAADKNAIQLKKQKYDSAVKQLNSVTTQLNTLTTQGYKDSDGYNNLKAEEKRLKGILDALDLGL